MIFRRLMAMPRFCFAEAVQSVEGTPIVTKVTSLLLSPILLQVATQVPFSLLPPKAMLCKQ